MVENKKKSVALKQKKMPVDGAGQLEFNEHSLNPHYLQ